MGERQQPLIVCGNKQKADIRFQDGGLPYALGVKNYQVMRAQREAKEETLTWTYNHAPMLAYWKGRFWIEYISGRTGEHVPPSRSMLTCSADGRSWSVPETVFPPLAVEAGPYCGPGREQIEGDTIPCIMHQRMGFYVSKSGRLLVLGFYGFSPNPHIAPNNGYGLGRVVREIREDGSFSELYFLRKNPYGGYDPSENTYFPMYTEGGDDGLVNACKELLEDRITTQQWWEEERLDTGFFGCGGGKAISCYTLPDGRVLGVCKNAMVTRTDREGSVWEPLECCPTLETATGKVWGQRTPDGSYALVYNPTTDSAHRWPLAVICGEDGRAFDGLLALTPEVSPCRYAGMLKNLGPQYIRGICEKYPQPDDGAMWLTYSVNKEDIWAAQVPVPVKSRWEGTVDEVLDETSYAFWNCYCPKWSGISLVKEGAEALPCLRMEDTEPYDRPRALRLFERAAAIRLTVTLRLDAVSEQAGLVVELQEDGGKAPVRLRFGVDGFLHVRAGGAETKAGEYRLAQWMELTLWADCAANRFEVEMKQDGCSFQKSYAFSQSVENLERVLFTTKAVLPWNTLEDCGRYGDMGDLPDSGQQIQPAVCLIHRIRVEETDI